MAQFFRVRNWSKYQHYKDRRPPWVKLYCAWPNDYEWAQWNDASKLLAVCLVMLAAQCDNKIPSDVKWIQQRCCLQRPPDLRPLLAVGFIEETEQIASKEIAERKQNGSNVLPLARSRETETETETEGALAPLVAGLDLEAWKQWLQYRSTTRKPIKPVSIPAAQRELAGFGADQAAVVQHSIANSYQGLFAPKNKPKAGSTIPGYEGYQI